MAIGTIKEHVFTEDELIDAFSDGYEQGAVDQINHREYREMSLNNTWDRRYATGYDHGFGEQAEKSA